MNARPALGRGGDTASRPLRIAVPKGALFAEAVDRLEAAGLDVGGLRDAGRTLIVAAPGAEYVISKPSDVPVYVAHGGVDCGIVGKDTLFEAGFEVVEMLDLAFGGCRFVVAEREDAAATVEEHYRHLGVIRVATKYPRVTEWHFGRKGIQVEVVKLHGNIELAPLIGVADRIVDITATGTTLRENGLRVVEEVMRSTARFVANPVSVKTDARVTALAERLAGTVA